MTIDPVSAERISQNDERRIVRALEVWRITHKPISSFQTQFDAAEPLHHWCVIGLRREKTIESQRINARVKKMLGAGLVNEVQALLTEVEPLSPQASAAIGYAEMIDHINGKYTLEEAAERIKINTRRLAKSQRTWFKTFRQVQWIDIGDADTLDIVTSKAIDIIEKYENRRA
jgi:tRNA dimethylallyltransferase